ncbi:unnamed protein product [Paramecium octaurelia]|uniref:Uncharacterized protein n=1 Tax=Paramecium octaurelia TaxID=43137 RepID=A0A8S1YN41_PAROT|nr:unnamed protein product [Paramecium octaurelia]CAD8215350.1 unnamed protein product [Paramecium octaurelia]
MIQLNLNLSKVTMLSRFKMPFEFVLILMHILNFSF